MSRRRNSDFQCLCGNDINSNPYALLGIKNCERDQKIIRKKGREVKAILHPDKNPNNAHAQESFIIATSATDILSDSRLKGLCDLKLRNICGREEWPRGIEAKVLDDFYVRRKHLQRAKYLNDWKAYFNTYLKKLKQFPQTSIASLSKYFAGRYRSQSGRVHKVYRSLRRWPHGARNRRTSTRPSTTSATPVGTGAAVKPPDSESLNVTPSKFPVTEFASARTVTITETQVVTRDKTETETVTVFGINLDKHRHGVEQAIANIDPSWLLGGVVACVCAAGCWYAVRRHNRERAHDGAPEELADREAPNLRDSRPPGPRSTEGLESDDESVMIERSQPAGEVQENPESWDFETVDTFEADRGDTFDDQDIEMDMDEATADNHRIIGKEVVAEAVEARKDAASTEMSHMHGSPFATTGEHIEPVSGLSANASAVASEATVEKKSDISTPEAKPKRNSKTPRTEPTRKSGRIAKRKASKAEE